MNLKHTIIFFSFVLLDIEKEIRLGVLESNQPFDQCACVVRNFEVTPEILQNTGKSGMVETYFDLTAEGRQCEELKQKLHSVCQNRLKASISKSNYHTFKLPWLDGGVSLTNSSHKVYLSDFAEFIKASLQDLVHQYMDKIQNERPPGPMEELQEEVVCHYKKYKKVVEMFQGRNDVIASLKERLRDCINQPKKIPLLIYGISGCGKTSVLAKLIKEARSWTDLSNLVIIYRFIGASIGSSTLLGLLKSICKQICQVYKIQMFWKCVYMNLAQIVTFFHILVDELKTQNRPLLIVVDGLEQLETTPNERCLVNWLPRHLNENCMIVLSTEANVKNIQRNFVNYYDDILNPSNTGNKCIKTDIHTNKADTVRTSASADNSKTSSRKSKKRPSFTLQRKTSKISPRVPLLSKRPAIPDFDANSPPKLVKSNSSLSARIVPECTISPPSEREDLKEPTTIPDIKLNIAEEDDEPELPNSLQKRESMLSREKTFDGLLIGRESTNLNNGTSGEVINSHRHIFKLQDSLSSEDREAIHQRILKEKHRTLSGEQSDYLKSCTELCQNPLYIKLVTELAIKWESHHNITSLTVPMMHSEVIDHLFDWLEKQCGANLTAHALSYITLSKHGLTEPQLMDILSLDNLVLTEAFEESSPLSEKLIQLPTLLWKRLRYYLGDYLEEQNYEGYNILQWCHRQFGEVVTYKYLQNESKIKHLSRTLSEFHLGLHHLTSDTDAKFMSLNRRGGRKKIRYAMHQLTPQPNKYTNFIYNKRKLFELPYCVITNGNEKVLFSQLFFNFNWLKNKMNGTSINDVISDYDQYLKKSFSFEVQFIRNAFHLNTLKIEKDKAGFEKILQGILAGIDLSKYPNLKKLSDALIDVRNSSNAPKLYLQEKCIMPKENTSLKAAILQPGYIKYVKFINPHGGGCFEGDRIVCISLKNNKIYVTFYGFTMKPDIINMLACITIPTEVQEPIIMLSKTSSLLAIALDDLHVIDTKVMTEVCTVASAHQENINCIQESHDGALFTIVYNNGVVRVLEMERFKIVAEIDTGCATIDSVYFMDQNTNDILLIPFLDNDLAIADYQELRVDKLGFAKTELIKPNSPMLFNDDRLTLINAFENNINMWNIGIRTFFTFYGHTRNVLSLAELTTETFASGCAGGEVRIWDLTKEALLHTLTESHHGSIISIRASRISNTLITCADDDVIKVWNLQEGGDITQEESITNGRIVCLDADEAGSLIFTGSKNKELRIFEIGDDRKNYSSRHYNNNNNNKIKRCINFAVSPSNEHALLTLSPNRVILWDIVANNALWEHNEHVTCTCFATQTHFFLGTNTGDLHIGKIERKGRTNTVHHLHDKQICLIERFQDNSIFICSTDGTILNFHFTDRSVQQTSQPHNDVITCVTLATNYVAFGSDDCRISIFSHEGAKMSLLHICTSETPIACLAIDNKRGHVVSGRQSGAVDIWDIESGNILQDLGFSISGLSCIVTNALTSKLLIGGNSRKRQLIEIDYTCPDDVTYLSGHKDLVTCIRITTNLKYVVSASHDGRVRVWENDTKRLVDSVQIKSQIVDLVVTNLQENWFYTIYAFTKSGSVEVLKFQITSRRESKKQSIGTGHLIMLHNAADGFDDENDQEEELTEVKKSGKKNANCCIIL